MDAWPKKCRRWIELGWHAVPVRIIVALILALACAPTAGAAANPTRRLRACFVSLNAPDEVEIFRSHLDPSQFDVIDISPPERPPGADVAANPLWILDACVPDLHCDVVVISGEFAGDFFGTRGWLKLQAMEEASCQQRCDGLFHDPREVFLLACNTLAAKDQDSRTPETYLGVLLEHGFERGLAERVVELRYGPLGPSFRESLRRVFAGVPHLYGFSSVAPRAEYSAPMVERYLHANADYAAALRHTGPNPSLRAAFAGTAMTETTGVLPGEAVARDREQLCALYDESRSVDDRMRIAYGLILRPDALRFIPTLQAFFSRHPPQDFAHLERSILLEMHAAEDTRDTVLELVRTLDGSALQLELAHFAAAVGWMERDEFHALAAAAAAEMLRRPPTAETVDVLCEIVKYESLRGDFSADDLAAALYHDAQGLRLVACLAPADPRVVPHVVDALRASDPLQRQWAAYALTQLRPSDPAVLAELVPFLRDTSPEVAARIRWLLQVQESLSPAVLRAMEETDRAEAEDGRTKPRCSAPQPHEETASNHRLCE